MGAIQAKLDFDLLIYLKKKHPEWIMLLVGKEYMNNEIDKTKFRELKSIKGVYHIGHVRRELIPGILRYVDVCLITFKENEFLSYASGPLKLWEYLAAGKPIVAVQQDSTYECSEFVRVGHDKVGFEEAVSKAIAEGHDSQKILERKKIARANSWNYRVDEMLNLIETELKRGIFEGE